MPSIRRAGDGGVGEYELGLSDETSGVGAGQDDEGLVLCRFSEMAGRYFAGGDLGFVERYIHDVAVLTEWEKVVRVVVLGKEGCVGRLVFYGGTLGWEKV